MVIVSAMSISDSTYTRVRIKGRGRNRRGGEAVFSFGKHAGSPLREVAETAPDYLDWMLGEDFPEETLAILRDAQEGSLPERDGEY